MATADDSRPTPLTGSSDGLEVTRCICFELSFEELLAACRRERIDDLESIRDAFGCGTSCGLCAPYVELMLATGRTRFRVDEALD